MNSLQPQDMEANYYTLLDTHYKVDRLKDPRYGDVVVYKDNHDANNMLLYKSSQFHSIKASEQYRREVEEKRKNDNKTLSELRGYTIEENPECCSTYWETKLLFEFYDRNLQEELFKKNQHPDSDEFTKYFFEPEIWYIFDSLIMLEKSFMTKGYFHGDIQPYTMHIDPSGFIKLLDTSLINGTKTPYQKRLNGDDYTAAMSPQLLYSLRNGQNTPQHDQLKSEVWAIGLTTLCASVNTSVSDYYDWNRNEVR